MLPIDASVSTSLDMASAVRASQGGTFGKFEDGDINIASHGGVAGGVPKWVWYLLAAAAAFIAWKQFSKKKGR